MEIKIRKMEEDFTANNGRNIFKAVRELREGKPKKSLLTVKISMETLNPEALKDLNLPNNRASNEQAPSKEEIRKGKEALGIDQITAEMLKEAGNQ